MSTDRWMDKEDVVHTHTYTHTHTHTHTHTQTEYYSAIKKEWNNTICSNVDGPITLSEVRQTNIIWYRLYVESKKWYQWTYLQNRNRLRDLENKLMVTTEERWGARDKLGGWD